MYIKKNSLIAVLLVKPNLPLETITMSVIVLFAFVSSGQAVPNCLNYQGRLVAPSTGQPISDGSHNVTFRIYDNATSGSLLWEDTYSVPTKNGLFNTLLGPIDASVFDGSDRWMEVGVDGEIIGLVKKGSFLSVKKGLQNQHFFATIMAFKKEEFLERKRKAKIVE